MNDVGSKWAHVEIVGEGEKLEEMIFDGGGRNTWMVETWQLRCECGKEFEVIKKGFARKLYRDCGCGAGKEDSRTTTWAISIPIKLREDIEMFAREQTQGNASHAAVILIRAGLQVYKSESNGSNWKESEVKNAAR